MSTSARPRFSQLTRDESERLLERNHVGRMAFSFRDHVDIEPIHYVYFEGWIYGRTSPGEKMTMIAHHPYVAFEVDEVEGIFDWRSVVVQGTVYPLDPRGSPNEQLVYPLGLELLRTLVPETLDEGDPTPFRTLLFRIHVREVTGRSSTTKP